MITARDLADAAAEANLPPSEYFSWFEEMGRWQLEALKAIGLQKQHDLLDIGCGAMRLGLYAVPELGEGRYCGVDAFPPYIQAGRRLAQMAGLPERYELLCCKDFCFERFGRKFDLAIAQSVFTHMTAEDVRLCVAKTVDAMKPGGKFLFTYLVGLPATQGFLYAGVQPMRRQDVVDDRFFHALAAEFGLEMRMPDVKHPTQQVAMYVYP